MKRRLAAAILTATVTAGAVTLPAAAEWDRGEQDTTACVETVGTPQGTGWQQIGGILVPDHQGRQLLPGLAS